MVQVQSSWFPLYDRNPQTFVPNIFWAKPEDYAKATQRVYHAPDRRSFVELPLVPSTPGVRHHRSAGRRYFDAAFSRLGIAPWLIGGIFMLVTGGARWGG